jgi:predicted small secreted protein
LLRLPDAIKPDMNMIKNIKGFKMNKSALPFVALVLAFVMCAGLTGCNTAEGFGRDLEGAGRSIQNTF